MPLGQTCLSPRCADRGEGEHSDELGDDGNKEGNTYNPLYVGPVKSTIPVVLSSQRNETSETQNKSDYQDKSDAQKLSFW